MNINNQKKVQHLYWRAGFGLSPKKLGKKKNVNVKEEAKKMIQKATKYSRIETPSFADTSTPAQRKESRTKCVDLNEEWVQTMATTDNPLLERMALFWHGHFACRIVYPTLLFNYLETIRSNALGHFKDLVLAVSKDPAMIRYLNNQQNRKGKPNENYARELMELFTIGRGNYTEKDVKEAARAFTGWSSNKQGEFTFREKWHDYNDKTFMNETGNFGGEEVIDIILKRKETARFIVEKIYKYFVNQKVETALIDDLADSFYESDYHIGQLMQTIFTSDWFYHKKNIGTKIKSPVDLLVGIMQVFKIDFETKKNILFIEKTLGQILFNPPNVAGWAGGKAWIDDATLMFRLNLVGYLFLGVDVNLKVKEEFEAQNRALKMKKIKATTNPEILVNTFKKEKEEMLFEALKTYIFQPEVKIERELVDGFTIQDNKEDYIKTSVMRLMSMPEYQLA